MSEQTVVVTGASRGIGRIISFAFAKQGANVVAVGRDDRQLAMLGAEFGALDYPVKTVVADLRHGDDVKRVIETAVQHFGGLDVLVNNAGIAGPTQALEDTSLEDWSEMVDSNLTSAFLCSKFAVVHMKSQGWGRIVNVSSISAKRGLPFRTGYCASKAALIGFTRSLAAELGPHGITVNAVCPGFVEGDRMERVIHGQGEARGLGGDVVRAEMESASPLRRFVRAEEVASFVLYLASEEAGAITGEDIDVSAGVR